MKVKCEQEAASYCTFSCQWSAKKAMEHTTNYFQKKTYHQQKYGDLVVRIQAGSYRDLSV